MDERNDMDEDIKVEEEEGYFEGDKSKQSFVPLLRVTQATGKLLTIGGFTGKAMAQML